MEDVFRLTSLDNTRSILIGLETSKKESVNLLLKWDNKYTMFRELEKSLLKFLDRVTMENLERLQFQKLR